MPGLRALASPASLKGVLPATEAAAALVEGLRAGGAEADALPVADGGEGTADVLHAALGGAWQAVQVEDAFGAPRTARWLLLPDGTAVVEAAAAVPLDPSRLDPLAASSRGLATLIRATGAPTSLLVTLGGTATMDAGAGLLAALSELPAPTRVLCDVRTTLPEAPAAFGPQKGATPELVAELEERFRAAGLNAYAGLPGGGAAGGLGAALASLGAKLVPGAPFLLDLIGFDPAGYDLVVTAEGTVDATTRSGKAPAEVARRCAAAGVRCVVAGGRVLGPVEGAETVALSGDPARAWSDLVELGRDLVAQSN